MPHQPTQPRPEWRFFSDVPATRLQFAALMLSVCAEYNRVYAEPQTVEEAVSDIEDQAEWLASNLAEDESPEVMVDNLASMIAACNRLADVLLARLTEEQLAYLIAQHQPEQGAAAAEGEGA